MRSMQMRSNNVKPIQGVLLMVSLFLTACGGGGKSVATCNPAPAPVPIPAPVVTSMGTDFYLTLPDHLCVSNPAICVNTPVTNKMIVAAATATTGEVTFMGVITPFSVASGGEAVITLDPAVVLTTNEVIEAKGIHVTALSPISVHVVSETTRSADGYLALPTAGLGTNYYVMSYASSRYTGSEFAVVATQNNTVVTITPSAAGLTKPANVAFTVLLNTGETYQITNTANADMTGTNVTADKPISVFGAHRCADIPNGTGYCDYLVEQLPNVSIWGNTHHTSLFSGRSNYTVRVMASQNGTTFTTSPPGLIGTLDAGQFADVTLAGVGEFVSNNPVLVAQYMRGYAADAAGKGDPSMVIVTPAEQGMTDSTFGVHGLAGTTVTSPAFMNVVTETASIPNLILDSVAVNPALFTPVGGTSIYSTGTIPVAPGAHTLLGSVPYSALVYDYGIASNQVSYAYPVAAKLSISAPATPTPAPSNPSPPVCASNQTTGSNQSDADSEHEEHASNDHHDHHGDDGHELEA
jgi:hypothetical protein